MYFLQKAKTTPPCRKCDQKWYQIDSLVVGMAFVFKLRFWIIDLFGTIAHENKNVKSTIPSAILS